MTTRGTGRPKTAAQETSRANTDQPMIKKWAEDRGIKPAAVKGTGAEENGVMCLMFPGYGASRSQTLREITWDEV